MSGIGQAFSNAAQAMGWGNAKTGANQVPLAAANSMPSYQHVKGISYSFNIRAIENGFIFAVGRGDGYTIANETYCATAQDIADQVLKVMVVDKMSQK